MSNDDLRDRLAMEIDAMRFQTFIASDGHTSGRYATAVEIADAVLPIVRKVTDMHDHRATYWQNSADAAEARLAALVAAVEPFASALGQMSENLRAILAEHGRQA